MIETVLGALFGVLLVMASVAVVACWVVYAVLLMVWPVTLLFARTNVIPMPINMRVAITVLSLGVPASIIFMADNGMGIWPEAVLVVAFYVVIAGVLLPIRPIAHKQKSATG